MGLHKVQARGHKKTGNQGVEKASNGAAKCTGKKAYKDRKGV